MSSARPSTEECEVEWLEEMRFLVRSRSRPDEWHLVDLTEYDGRGECSCETWRFKCLKLIKSGAWGERVTCAHVRACHRRVIIQIVRKRKEQHEAGEEN